jgi:hypothetical protein
VRRHGGTGTSREGEEEELTVLRRVLVIFTAMRCVVHLLDEVAVASSVVYVLGGSVIVLQKSLELLEELAKLADGWGRVCSSRRGVFAKPSETGPTASPPWHGTRGGSGVALYEFAPPRQGFVWRDNDLKGFV